MEDEKHLNKRGLAYYTKGIKGFFTSKEVTAQLEQSIKQLQNSTHTHSNKTVLDGVTSGKISNWNTAYTQRHTHTNKTVLDNITSEKVAEWNEKVTNLEQTTENLAEWNNSWGDFTPGTNNMYSDAFITHYIPNGDNGKRSFAVVPHLSDTEDNALAVNPSGLYVKDLSSDLALKPGLKTEEGGEIFCDYKNNKATGNCSATFGSFNTVSGDSSFSIGHQNTISGNASFSAGSFNSISWNNSLGVGQYLLVSSDNQIVAGKNNEEDTNGKYIFILGNGSDAGHRRNAFAIDVDGNIYVNGSTSGVNIQELATAVSNSSAARNIYINAETGDDYSNTGLSSSSPFKTIEKALSYTQYNNKVVFNLAPGEYTMPGNSKLFSNVYRRFHGNSSDDTIIKTGEIQSDRSYLYFENLTLSSSTGVSSILKAQHHGSVYVKNCVVDTPHTYCIYATAFSDICVANTTLKGAKSYALSVIDGSNIRVNNCIDNTGKGIRVGATSVAHICDTSENPITYHINSYGMVYLNGQQVAPTPTSETAILSMGGNV